ncbi:hypothetical protein R1sor_009999 [Riccia sorocarpa]|uniref:Uncharacterized protein n=1 Tax=Riccia sorocarpa TaxID=122646 RepID=A0ABD3HWU6_9MARC
MTRHILISILMAIPIYTLMTLGLTSDDYDELTKICMRLIWGSNREGKDKKVMIAWKKLCAKRDAGGLGLMGFDIQAKALKLRMIAKVLNRANLDWVFLFRTIMEWKILDTQSRESEIGLSAETVLLIGRKLDLRSSPTAARLLQDWWEDDASNEEMGVSTVDLNRPSLEGSDWADQEENLESALENLGFFTTP